MSVSKPLNDLQAYAEQFIQDHKVPAISVAIWKDNRLTTAAAGCLNQDTGGVATTESIFQIGSITKVMTTSLVMQLVDEGKVDLDRPVKHYLQDFMIADAEATSTITIRHLLCHISGIAGDYFPDDSGQQGNLIARYVDRCSLLPLVHPVGEMWSYSNAAFAIAGRLVEVVRGISWYQAMQDYLYTPLGMDQAIVDPKDMIRFSTAAGHIYEGNNTDSWIVPKQPFLTMGQAPAGTTPAMTAENLIRFARAHMENGFNQQEQSWLSAGSIAEMQKSQMELPKASQISAKHTGLGWGITEFDNPPLRVLSHGGGTNGFLSMLQLIPEQNAAFAVLINGFRPSAIEALTGELLGALADIKLQQPEPSSQKPIAELNQIAGVYESFDTLITVTATADKLQATIVYKIDPLPPLDLDLRHVEEGCFAPYTKEGNRCPNVVFVKPDKNGVPQYIFNGGRLSRRL